MRIQPSIRGFYIKNYWVHTLAAGAIAAIGFYFNPLGGLDGLLIASGLAVVIVALGLAHAILYTRTTHLYLTAEEVVYEEGMLSHTRTTAPIHMITDSKIRRSFFDRLLGVADFYINTSGTSGVEIEALEFEYDDLVRISDEIHGLIRKTPHSLEREKTHGQ